MGHETENLSAHLDGALLEAESRRVAAHLEACSGCRAEFAELRALSARVKGLPQKPLPAGFLARLAQRRRGAAPSPGTAFSAQRLAWAFCAVTVMFVTYKGLRLQQEPFGAAPARVPAAAALSEDLGLPQKGASGPVSTQDLIAMSKEADRRAGLLAMGEGGLAGSAAGLSAPAPAPRRFGGRALGEPAQAEAKLSNEALQAELEKQKARLGIKRIIPPSPLQSQLAAVRGAGQADTYKLEATPGAAAMAGVTPALLAKRSAAPSRKASEGALVAPEDFSAGPAPARPMAAESSTAPPASAPAREAPGQAVRSPEELLLLWRQRGLPPPMPEADFSRQMVVVVFGGARIDSAAVDASSGRLVVRYRLVPVSAPQQRWRVVPALAVPVVFVRTP